MKHGIIKKNINSVSSDIQCFSGNNFFSFPRSCVGMHRKLNIGIEVWIPTGDRGNQKTGLEHIFYHGNTEKRKHRK